MPTIKRKVEMNLPELIEWGWKNEIEKRSFISNDGKVTANFEDMGRFIADNFISSDVTFTVEIEEKITEDTVLPRLVKYTYNSYYEHRDKSINMLDRAKEWSTFYYKDDNENMYLIWRDGKMVE